VGRICGTGEKFVKNTAMTLTFHVSENIRLTFYRHRNVRFITVA